MSSSFATPSAVFQLQPPLHILLHVSTVPVHFIDEAEFHPSFDQPLHTVSPQFAMIAEWIVNLSVAPASPAYSPTSPSWSPSSPAHNQNGATRGRSYHSSPSW